jgi:hypothetical protein
MNKSRNSSKILGLMGSKRCMALKQLKDEMNMIISEYTTNVLRFNIIYNMALNRPGSDIEYVKELQNEFFKLVGDEVPEEIKSGFNKTKEDLEEAKRDLSKIYYKRDLIDAVDLLLDEYCADSLKQKSKLKQIIKRPRKQAQDVINKLNEINTLLKNRNSALIVLLEKLNISIESIGLKLKTRENYSHFKSSSKVNSSDVMNNSYYVFRLDNQSESNTFITRFVRGFSMRDYDYTREIIFFDDLDNIPISLMKIADELRGRQGDSYEKYMEHTRLCYESRNMIRSDDQNLDRIFVIYDLTNNEIVFTFNIDKYYMIYDLCKTMNPLYRNVRTNNILKVILSRYDNDLFVYLDFTEKNFDKTVAFLVRSGFYLKGSSVVPNNTRLEHYNVSQRYLLLSYNSQKAESMNYNTLNVSNLVAVANNIKTHETSMKTYTYQLDNASIRKLLTYMYNWSGEVSGSFTKKEGNILECLDKNMLTNKGNIIVKEDLEMLKSKHERCGIEVLHFDIVNFHIHPLTCYIQENITIVLGIPSIADINAMFGNDIKDRISLTEYRFHIVATMEGLYTIQIHPYWINKFNVWGEFIEYDWWMYIHKLIELNQTYLDIIIKSMYKENVEENLIQMLYFINNKFTINNLAKEVEHTKLYLSDIPSDLQTEEEIRKWYKDKFYASDIDRNMNLFAFNFIPYQWKPNSDLAKMNPWDIPTHLIEYMEATTIKEMTDYVMKNLSDDNLEAIYSYF